MQVIFDYYGNGNEIFIDDHNADDNIFYINLPDDNYWHVYIFIISAGVWHCEHLAAIPPGSIWQKMEEIKLAADMHLLGRDVLARTFIVDNRGELRMNV